MATNIAINGFGRIGRAFFKLALSKPELNIVAINDLGDPEGLAYLLRYDSVYGRYHEEVSVKEAEGAKYLVVGGHSVQFLQEKDPTKLPWGDMKVDIALEATGVFTKFEQAQFHVDAGAKRVVLTAPAKDEDSPDAKTVLMGVNEEELKTCTLSSNGSCTTNSASPILSILADTIGVEKAFLNTVHGYTATQSLVDGPTRSSDPRKGRAAGVNIIPSSTGSAIAVGRAVHSVTDKFDGFALRVPVLVGSLSNIVFISPKDTSEEEINDVFKKAEKDKRWEGIFRTSDEPIVSTDIIGDPYAAIADLTLTKVVDGNLCAVYSWYDNEFGYTNSLVDHVLKVAKAQ